ncbi:MAG: hypothetical protein ACRC2H_12780 [Silanimonas sp.]
MTRPTAITPLLAALLLAPAAPATQADAVIDTAACTISVDGKTFPLAGKVQFVDAFPDFTIRWVDAFADLHMKRVDSFPDACGKWQEVNAFPDFKVKVVDSFEDLTVKRVDSFPGLQ